VGDGVARGHGAEGDVRHVWSELRTESAMTPTQVEKLDAERVPRRDRLASGCTVARATPPTSQPAALPATAIASDQRVVAYPHGRWLL